MTQRRSPSRDAFIEQAARPGAGIFWEFVEFLFNNRRWWLTPIVLALLMAGGLIILSGTPVAPFIYTLF